MVRDLSKTKIVLSKILRIITLIIWGLRYGGSSRMKELGVSGRRNLDKILETIKVIMIPRIIINIKKKAFNKDEVKVLVSGIKNMEIRAIRRGNRPLQGITALVIMAIKRSFLVSMIRQPVTPTALQPKPIHIVKACFPQV